MSYLNLPMGAAEDWDHKLQRVIETMREISRQTDPQAVVKLYAAHVRDMVPRDAFVAISRRGLATPQFRVTRSSVWKDEVNPWKQKEQLPLFSGGLLGDLIYAEEPVLLDDVTIASDDPAIEYLGGFRSVMAIPQYHEGQCLNMIVNLSRSPAAFPRAGFPDLVMLSNLFGRATSNLVLAEELKAAQAIIEGELKLIGDIQRSLLPQELPAIPRMQLAVHYQTSRQAGGDYYDFFAMPDGSWGIFLADVSGHGTPSAVVMAITHAIAHAHPGPPAPPSRTLRYLNRKLALDYTTQMGAFVTAFYGIFNPARRTLVYGSAGHNPPRLARAGTVQPLDAVDGMPLGIADEADFPDEVWRLLPDDTIVFYTDGLIESFNSTGEQFGLERLDALIAMPNTSPQELLDRILEALNGWTGGQPLEDDCTIVVAGVE